METKICIKCKIERDLPCFHKNKNTKDGLYIWCKKCSNQYRQDHKEEISIQRRQHYQDHKKERNQYESNKRKTNISYKLAHYLRSRLYKALKNNYKSGSAIRDLGCTIDELKLHLESKFQPGMAWDNCGKFGWHIDHIIPLSKFSNLSQLEQLKEACHYTNLQPLWAEDNLKKGNR